MTQVYNSSMSIFDPFVYFTVHKDKLFTGKSMLNGSDRTIGRGSRMTRKKKKRSSWRIQKVNGTGEDWEGMASMDGPYS